MRTAVPLGLATLGLQPLGLGMTRGGGGVSFDFYVDSVNGSDANDGTSPAQAFATLGAAETAALAFGNGVKIGLKYGSDWRGRLDLNTLSGLTVDAYGDSTDGLPIIRCDDVLTGTWATSADRADANANVYSRSFAWTGLYNVWITVREDGDRLVWASSLANCQATPGTFFLSGGGTLLPAGSGTLFVHPFGSTNPNSDGKVYEGGTRDVAIRTGDNSTVRNLWVKNSPGAAGGLVMGEDCLAEKVLGEGGTVHDILLASGTQRFCVGWLPYVDTRVTPLSLEFYTLLGAGLSGLWDRCIVVSTPGGGTGFGGHTNGVSFYDSWELRDCAVQGAEIGGNDVATVTITRPNLVNAAVSLTCEGTTPSLTITDPWVKNTGSFPQLIRRFSAFGSGSVTMTGLRYYSTANEDRWFFPLNTGGVTFQASTAVDAGNATARRRLVWVSTGVSYTGSGIVIDSRGTNTITAEFRGFRFDTGSTFSSNNNVLNPESNDNLEFEVGGTLYQSTTAYFAAVRPSNEANSVIANPSISDPANGNFTIGASGLPTGAGAINDPTCQNYTSIPADLAAAEAWILSA